MTHEERLELLGELIGIFEDFLEARGITIHNPERDEDPDAAIIYGTDYGEMESNIEQILIDKDLLEEERRV